MIELVFFLEEPSAEAVLQGLMPRLVPQKLTCRYIVFLKENMILKNN